MRGIYYGAAIFGAMSYFNANMTLRINTFVVCCLWDWTSHRFNRAHPVNSLNFMNWALANRTARARVENDAGKFGDDDKKLVRDMAGTSGHVLDMYEQVFALIDKDSPKGVSL